MSTPTTSFEALRPHIERTGRAILPDFVLDESNEWLYQLLTLYFTRNPAFDRGEDRMLYPAGLNLRKGLLLKGPVGTGKTIPMLVFQKLTGTFRWVSTREIAREYAAKGAAVIDRFAHQSQARVFVGGQDIGIQPLAYCFDDIGMERKDTKHYANELNVMAEIISDRYDLMRSRRMVTHGTTNNTADQFEAMYGDRVRDRMREMFNIINVTGESRRK